MRVLIVAAVVMACVLPKYKEAPAAKWDCHFAPGSALCGGAFRRIPFDVREHRPVSVARTVFSNMELWRMGTEQTSLIISDDVPAKAGTLEDTLYFLASAIIVVPLCKQIKLSPVLGFLLAGFALGPKCLGLFDDIESIDQLAEIGILFLLFEQGLELSTERLQKLSKYAFGLGTLQVAGSALVIAGVAAFGGGAALESIAQMDIISSVLRPDQLTVIGVSLALSSSAFVLKVLQELNLAPTTLGQAALGVLLFQDIAVVPLLVLLPVIEDNSGSGLNTSSLATFVAQAVAGLGAIALLGGTVLKQLFRLVATAKSPETFVGLCIFCVLGMSQLTATLGLSNTLGAFLAGTLLAESSYRTQIEADIMPFRGLLLGLFFLTTGAQVEPDILLQEWETSLILLFGIILCKVAVVFAFAPFFGLSARQGVKLGFILGGGGEFAFVIFTLAGKLAVLPLLTIKLLRGVVVVSMALTPLLAWLGDRASSLWPETKESVKSVEDRTASLDSSAGDEETATLVLILGMGPVGQQVASVLTGFSSLGVKWIGMDVDASTVMALRKMGQPVYYGDGTKLAVVSASSMLAPPKIIVVAYSGASQRAKAVERLKSTFPQTPVITHAANADTFRNISMVSMQNSRGEVESHLRDRDVHIVSSSSEVGVRLGRELLHRLFEVPTGVSDCIIQQVREETERRLVTASLQGSDELSNIDTVEGNSLPEADAKEGCRLDDVEDSLYFVGSSIEACDDVWNAIDLADLHIDDARQVLDSFESLSLLELAAGSDLQDFVAKVSGTSGEVVEFNLKQVSYEPGDTIFAKGDVGCEMFIIAAGECIGTVPSRDGGPDVEITRFKAGDYFGEIALLTDDTRAASVIAKTQMQVLSIDRQTFFRLVESGALSLQSLEERVRCLNWPVVLPNASS